MSMQERSTMAGGRPRICALLHPGRVGSTVLATALTSQPLIAAGEIYNASIYPSGEWWTQHDYVDHFRQLFGQRLKLPQPYLGQLPAQDGDWYLFEYKPFHTGCGAPLHEAVQAFRQAGVSHFVSLLRSNHIRRYVSYLIAMKTGVWHTHRAADRPHAVRIDLQQVHDYDIGFASGTLLQCLDHYYTQLLPQWERALQDVPHLMLRYEDHVEHDPVRGYRAIVDFLGLDESLPPAVFGQARQNAWPLQQLIENFDEVERALRGTLYAALLQD
jgi:hypothetical protein